jgi:hypothetical protein
MVEFSAGREGLSENLKSFRHLGQNAPNSTKRTSSKIRGMTNSSSGEKKVGLWSSADGECAERRSGLWKEGKHNI